VCTKGGRKYVLKACCMPNTDGMYANTLPKHGAHPDEDSENVAVKYMLYPMYTEPMASKQTVRSSLSLAGWRESIPLF